MRRARQEKKKKLERARAPGDRHVSGTCDLDQQLHSTQRTHMQMIM